MVKKTNYLKKRKNMSNKKKSYPRKLHHKRSLAKKSKSKKLYRKRSYRKERSYRKRKFKGGMMVEAAQARVRAQARVKKAQEDAMKKALSLSQGSKLAEGSDLAEVFQGEIDANSPLGQTLTRQTSPSSPVPSPKPWNCTYCSYLNDPLLLSFSNEKCGNPRCGYQRDRGSRLSPSEEAIAFDSAEHELMIAHGLGVEPMMEKTNVKFQQALDRYKEQIQSASTTGTAGGGEAKKPHVAKKNAPSPAGKKEEAFSAGGGWLTAIAGSDAKEGATESAAAAVGGFGDPYYLYQQSLNSMEVKLNLLLQNKNRTDENFYEYQKKITEIITLLKSISNAPSDKIELWMTKNGRPKLLVKLLSSINLDIHGDPK